MELPLAIQSCSSFFQRLPGIGEKSAQRLLFSILKWKKQDIALFSKLVSDLQQIKRCQLCQNYSEEEMCLICQDEERLEQPTLCVVENVGDLLAIERTGQFRGTYFSLNGVLNPLLGVGPQELGVPKLLQKISQFNISQVILALNPSLEGDATCSFLKETLESLQIDHLVVERIGMGMPMGGSLEYLDSLTITKAFENRRTFL